MGEITTGLETSVRDVIATGVEGLDTAAGDRVNAVLQGNPQLEATILEADVRRFAQQTDIAN